MSKIKTISLYLLGILLILAGINHFIMAEEVYLKIMPPYLGWHKELVFLSGLIEIGLGVLLLLPQYRKIAAWGVILLLIAVFPANIYLAQTNGAVLGVSPLVAWGRIPLQVLFLLWAWWFTKDEKGNKSSAKAKPKPESADNYFELITDAELLELALALRYLIKRTLPGVSECVKWDLPFYTYHGNLCYINMRKGHLELGFYRGIHLSNSSGLLQGNGKLIRHIILHPSNDLPQARIVETLLEASKVNENGPLRLK